MDTKPCPKCKATIPADASHCQHCGKRADNEAANIAGLIAIVFVVVVLAYMFTR